MRLHSFSCAAAAALLVGASVEAQTTIYVDPTHGVDHTSGPSPSAPYRTINYAIGIANFGDIVHLHPGIYSAQTNGETLPVRMQAGVDVHSAGADKVVILGDGSSQWIGPQHFPEAVGVFLPESPIGTDGRRDATLEVLVDFSGAGAGERIEGVTFRGGDIQVYQEYETFGRSAVQNCVFDMLHEAPDPNADPRWGPIAGPAFGLLSVAVYDWDAPQPIYHQGSMEFLNNTVMMAWQPHPGALATELVTCRNGAVGFCDVNDPATIYPMPIIGDTDNSLRSINDHLLVNNIFRTVTPQGTGATRALLGVDSTDTDVVVGTQLEERNAFDRNLVGGTTGPGGSLPQYWSIVVPALQYPRPVIDVNPANVAIPGYPAGRDAGYVGEYITRTHGWAAGEGPNDRYIRDWRLLPATPYKELGTSPVGNIIRVGNGLTYTDPVGIMSVFDYDGEEHGNPRIASDPQAPSNGGEVDLGFDEASNLIMARSNANDSVAHDDFVQDLMTTRSTMQAYPDGVGRGQDLRDLVTPSAGNLLFYMSLSLPMIPTLYDPPYIQTVEWPTLIQPVLLGGFTGYDSYYLANASGPLSIATTAVTNYLAPYDPNGLSFGSVANVIEPSQGLYFISVQGLFTPTVGNAAYTNVQNYHF
jgi:hypothetical protein